MTVCIAALCAEKMPDGGLRRVALCATDTKLSSEFTSASLGRKWSLLGGKWVTLLAASNLSHAELLIDEVKRRLRPPGVNEFESVLSVLGEARRVVIEKLAADGLPPGWTLKAFWAEGKDKLPESVYLRIYEELAAFRLHCELLVVGCDESGHIHIADVGEFPPTAHDRATFAVIGSGYWAATTILSAYDPTPVVDWRHFAYQVFAAKSEAERAEGVDDVTFMMRLSVEGIDYLDASALSPLLKEYGPLPPEKAWTELRSRLEGMDITMKHGGKTAHFPWADLK